MRRVGTPPPPPLHVGGGFCSQCPGTDHLHQAWRNTGRAGRDFSVLGPFSSPPLPVSPPQIQLQTLPCAHSLVTLECSTPQWGLSRAGHCARRAACLHGLR